jgi:hypothetical protein
MHTKVGLFMHRKGGLNRGSNYLDTLLGRRFGFHGHFDLLTSMCLHMHTYIHTYIHIYIHTYALGSLDEGPKSSYLP